MVITNSLHVVLIQCHCRTATLWMLVCKNPQKTKKADNFVRAWGVRMHLQHVHYIASHSIMIVIQNLPSLALKIQMRASVAIQTKWWRVWTALKRECLHFNEIFITGCTGSCQNDNFQCSQWLKFRQNDIFVSVWAFASACAYSTGLRNVSITPSNHPRQITFSCLEVIGL